MEMSFNPNQLFQGNALDLLPEMDENSIDLVITSPPYYKQRKYDSGKNEIGHEDTFEVYLETLFELFGACLRVVKPDGNIVFNLGDKRQDGTLTLLPYRFAIEVQSRFDIRLVNQITWVKTNPPPKLGNRLTDSTEPFFHFATGSNFYRSEQDWQPHMKMASKRRRNTRLGESYYGMIDKSSLNDEEKNNARRDLAAAIQSVNAGEYTEFRMKIRGLHENPYGGQAGGRQSQIDNNGYTIIPMYGNDHKMNYIQWAVETKGIDHPAPYPASLIREFVRYLCPPGGVVLDPMIGSGSTAVAALMEGRQYMGIELNPDYIEEAEKRIKQVESEPVQWTI